MHEMSIAMNIIGIASREAESAGARVVHAVEIDLGRLAGVELESLKFCYQVARANTRLATAELLIHDIPGCGHCAACDSDHEVDFFVALCPACGHALEISGGRDLRVRSLNID